MTIYTLSIGLTLRREQQLLEFRRMLGDDEIQFEDPLTGRIYNWSLAKLYREINENRLQVVTGKTADSVTSDSSPQLISSLDSLPQKIRDDLERKFDYIEASRKQGLTKGQRRLLKESIAKTAQTRNEKAPSTSSVMQWWRDLDDANMNPVALITKNHRRKRNPRIAANVLDLVRKVLRAEYFTRERHSLERSVLIVNRQLKTLLDDPVQVSTSTVRKIASEVDGYHRDVARYGAAYARNKWRYSLGGAKTRRILERVEVDHTQLDVVVVCDHIGLPMGRPTITIVVDSHSGYVIGFYVSFWGTGLGPTLNALKVAISPKQLYTEGVPNLTHSWMGHGIFELAVVDNGLEFHSQQFKLAAWHLNTDIQYCAVRQPWLKPTVERALGIVSQNLPSQGRVHKPENNYLPPDPRKTAAITFSQLCHGLLKHFVDVMPFEVNDYTLCEPYHVFQEGFAALPPPEFSASARELELVSAMHKTLTVGNAGIESNYLHYNSVELQQLRRQHSHSYKTVVKYQPEDLNYVYVQDPQSKDWLMVPSCNPEYTTGLSIVQHRAIRALKKTELKKRNAMETLIQGKLDMIDMYDGFLKGNLGKKNVKAAQQFGSLTSSQTLRSTTDSQEIFVRPAEQLVDAKENPMNQEKNIPTFSSFSLE